MARGTYATVCVEGDDIERQCRIVFVTELGDDILLDVSSGAKEHVTIEPRIKGDRNSSAIVQRGEGN